MRYPATTESVKHQEQEDAEIAASGSMETFETDMRRLRATSPRAQALCQELTSLAIYGMDSALGPDRPDPVR